MRILYCNKYSFPFSGTEVYLFELMQLMREQGHEVALFSMADPRAPKEANYNRYFVPHRDFKSAAGVIHKVRLAANAIYSREARQRLRECIHAFRPDVAHVRNIYHHLSPSILWELKSHAVPVVLHLNDLKLLCPTYNMVAHGHTCERCHGHRFWQAVRQGCYFGGAMRAAVLATEAYVHHWARTYERCVDGFLAPSEFVKTKLVENGWDAARIRVLPHFQRMPESVTAAPADAPILYFGRLSREKGIADLVRAMARLPEIRLQIAGDGPERSQLEELASGLGNIEFLGHVNTERLDELIRKSRFTVFPSRAYETFGKSILESYAHGRCVIASDLGSRRELVQHEVTGLLYPPGDVDQLAQAISFLCERPDVARQMGAAARTVVRLRYSPESHSHELTALYQDSVARTQAHKPARSTKVKVAFIGGRGVGRKYSGIESYYEQVGRNLVSRGHEVTAYSRSYFTPHVNEYDGIRIVRLPTIRSKHLETLLHTVLSTVHVLFTDCNIVHYHALGPAIFSFIPRLFGKRTVVTVQGLDWQRKKWNRFASAILRVGELASARWPNATMVVSRTLQNYYREHYGVDPTYIPNGTSIRAKRTPERIVALGLEPGNYILFLGRFSPEKNCDLLIQAFERTDTHVKLVLAGGSSHTDQYARKLRMHESDRIRLMDYVSGDLLDELLTNAMLFVLPSDLEGMSLALLDAMGAGVCVLASDIPENRELVEGAGFTFRRGDVDDLERMLRLLIFDQHAREAAAHASRERVREEYLWPAITRQIERVYYRVLGCSAEIIIRGYDSEGTRPEVSTRRVA